MPAPEPSSKPPDGPSATKIADEPKQRSVPNQTGMDMTHAQLVEQYGEDNADCLWEKLCNTEKKYSKITFIEMGVEPDGSFENTVNCAG